jgi:serine phosphatase RsbU (regulator of sigma subunit)
MAAAVISGVAVDALRRSRAEQEQLAVALAREEAAREAQQERVRLSEILTAALQPHLPARHGSLDVLTIYKPGESLLGLGGDLLDAVALPDGRLALIIGDVAGHGPRAAALGASLRASWRSLVLEGAAPADLMDTLEAVVEMEEPEDVFVTACLAWVDPDARRVGLILAGHPRPLLLSSSATPLEAPADVPLGLGGDGRWRLVEFDLPSRCSLFFYTDGLVEGLAGPRSRERFGERRLVARLEDMLKNGLSQATLARLVSAIEVANGSPLPDDVTALALVRRLPH